jgi:transposase
MMMKTRRTYNREFKLEALRLVETTDKSMAQIEWDLGIGEGCLRQWKKKLAAEGENAFPGHAKLPPDEERIRSWNANWIVRQERNIL